MTRAIKLAIELLISFSYQRLILTRIVSICLFILSGTKTIHAQNLEGRGKDFLLPFPNSIVDNMVLYVSTGGLPANVHITAQSDTGTWVKDYQIPANSTIESASVPVSVMLVDLVSMERTYNRHVRITSDVPVSAYIHFYGPQRAGSTMLVPVENLGYSYVVMDSPWDGVPYFCVVADHDNTLVEITCVLETSLGVPANQPFTVKLNKGQIYQLYGVERSGELTGSRVRSVANSDGVCFPVGVFSGSYGAFIHTVEPMLNSSGSSDCLIQQLVPTDSWGKKYLTAPFSTTVGTKGSTFNNAIFRVMVKDPSTVVKRNGVILTGLQKGLYYEYISKMADYIEADMPIMVVQFMLSQTEPGVPIEGKGDGEIFYLSSLEQSANKASFIRTANYEMICNYLTLIIPDGGLSSLTIDGSKDFSYQYPHPNIPGYTVVVKKWDPAFKLSTVQSDSSFTAITYGLGDFESYGYNILPQRIMTGSLSLNDSNDGIVKSATCTRTPFKFVLKTQYTPSHIEWNTNGVAGLSPNNSNIILPNPLPDSSVMEDGWLYNYYSAPQYDTFTTSGLHTVTVTIIAPLIENCSKSMTFTGYFPVKAGPEVTFDIPEVICMPYGRTDFVSHTYFVTNPAATLNYEWTFGDGSLAAEKDPGHYYTARGNYEVKLKATASNGCSNTHSEVIAASAFINRPEAGFSISSAVLCKGESVTLKDLSDPSSGGIIHQWHWSYNGLMNTEETPVIAWNTAGTSVIRHFVINEKGCHSDTLYKSIEVYELPLVEAGPDHEMQKNGSVQLKTTIKAPGNYVINWSPAASLSAADIASPFATPAEDQEYYISVTAGNRCTSTDSVTVRILPLLTIPSAFSPNGDGINDTWEIPGLNSYASATVSVFNRWGQKVYESKGYPAPWNGRHNGSVLPMGTYYYIIDTHNQIRKVNGIVTIIR